MKKVITIYICILLCVSNIKAGGALEQIDITGRIPAPVNGFIIGKPVPIKWDSRALPIIYSVNDTIDPIPNPLGPAFLSINNVKNTFQAAVKTWNTIPTSFIDMRVEKTTHNTKSVGFDFINEVSFRTPNNFSIIASSPSTSLMEDTQLDDGEDIDNDGDSDVSKIIEHAQDLDSDGDTEFPAGFYKAGTILDNDIQFNTKTTNGFRFTIDDLAIDDEKRSVDLLAVAVHEFGHSHGLSHTLLNQLSDIDGTSATMFPNIATTDPDNERGQRSLASDDIAWSSYLYPEGTASVGPGSLQQGDIPFCLKYSLIKGELTHGVYGLPIAGGHVFAVKQNTNTVIASGFSGKTQVIVDPLLGGVYLSNDPKFHILNGNYVIPVPRGVYNVRVEPIDGFPAATSNVSFTARVGSYFGLHDFNEEYYANYKHRLGAKSPIIALPGVGASDKNIVTHNFLYINTVGPRLGFIGNTNPNMGGAYYAVAIPSSIIDQQSTNKDLILQGINFDTGVYDASVVPKYAKAIFTLGSVSEDGKIFVDLNAPLATVENFIGQDNDFATFYFRCPKTIGLKVKERLANSSLNYVFLILQLPDIPFPGIHQYSPLTGISQTGTGISLLSVDKGITWSQINGNFRFFLIASNPVTQE